MQFKQTSIEITQTPSSLKRKRPPMSSSLTSKLSKLNDPVDTRTKMKRTEKQIPSPENISSHTSPDAYINLIIESHSGEPVKPCPAMSIPNYFLEPTEEHMASYTTEVLAAVQEQDIESIKALMKDGHSFQCCNRFGESVIHMACRRGLKKVLTFLLKEADLSVRIKDDYGRTPLHDACWSKDPQFEIIEMLLQQEPGLLFVTDKRGFTPFAYSRMEHWSTWHQFLYENRNFVLETEKLKEIFQR